MASLPVMASQTLWPKLMINSLSDCRVFSLPSTSKIVFCVLLMVRGNRHKKCQLSLNHLSVKEGSFAAFQVRQSEAKTSHFNVGSVIFSCPCSAWLGSRSAKRLRH